MNPQSGCHVAHDLMAIVNSIQTRVRVPLHIELAIVVEVAGVSAAAIGVVRRLGGHRVRGRRGVGADEAEVIPRGAGQGMTGAGVVGRGEGAVA